MIKLKICGMKRRDNIEEVAALGPAYLGFIFYEKSPRNFTAEIPVLDSAIKKTGVFVNASLGDIMDKIDRHSLYAVQLHGEESPDLCQALKTENIEVIKVFSVKENFDFQLLQPYEGKVDFFLFDTLGKSKGGNGETFNWDLLREYPSSTPFFLSGGIGEEEIEDIQSSYEHLKAQGKEELLYAVDVNSRFERDPGVKIPEKLRHFQKRLINIK